MSIDFETGRKNLEDLIRWYEERKSNRNEATTRKHLIDTLLIDCLGWTNDHMVLEESHEGDFADYTLTAPRRILIVEAKKEGNYFDLPLTKTRSLYNISTLSGTSTNISKAMTQVTRYCHTRGVPYAAISNGHQLITYIATRTDGKPPMEGKALAFPSLDHMKDNFTLLWNSLSREAIVFNQLRETLTGKSAPKPPSRLAESIVAYPGYKDRNVFQTDLQILSELVLEDLPRNPGIEEVFFKECYCQSGALSQHSLVSRSLLKSRYSSIFEPDSGGPTTEPATNKKGDTAILSDTVGKRPILLLGDVGAGKTSFINNLIKVDAKDLFADSITIYIDLGDVPFVVETAGWSRGLVLG